MLTMTSYKLLESMLETLSYHAYFQDKASALFASFKEGVSCYVSHTFDPIRC